MSQATEKRPPEKRKGPATSLKVAALMILGSLVFAVAMAEIGLRILGYPDSVHDPYVDPVLGITIPAKTVERDQLAEYPGRQILLQSNNLGFYEDQDTSPVPPPGTTRIAIVGDSQTAGRCPNPESYPNQLETLLNARHGGAGYDVINAGVGKYTPYQYLLKTRLQLVPIHVNHVIVALYLGNDLVDLTRQDDRPYLLVAKDGTIEAKPPHFIIHRDPRVPPGMLDRSRIYSLFTRSFEDTLYYQFSRAKLLVTNLHGHGTLASVRYMIGVKRLTDISRNYMTQILHQYYWFQQFPETLPAAFQIHREVMREFKELSQSGHFRLTYLLLPAKIQIEPDDMQAVTDKVAHYDPSMTPEAVSGFCDRFAAEVLRQAKELDVEVIDPRPAMAARRAGAVLYYHDDMHLKRDGNEVLAGILAEYLEAHPGNAARPQ